MLDILQYDFMVRALLAGLIAAVVIPALGTFMVARRYSLIADGLAHASLAGVGAGLLLGAAPLIVAVPVTMAAALALEWLRQKRQITGDVGLAIIMSSGLAVAIVLASLAQGGRADFNTYLFGSITTTTWPDIAVLLAAALVIIFVIASKYRAFEHIAFNEDSARIAGHPVGILNYLLAAMTAVMVVLSLQIVGGLLISALLVVPVVAAAQVSRSFAATIVYAIVAATIAVVAGLTLAFYAGIAAGGAIVLACVGLLVLAMICKR